MPSRAQPGRGGPGPPPSAVSAPRSPPPTSARSRAAASRAQSSGRVFQTCKRRQRGKGGAGESRSGAGGGGGRRPPPNFHRPRSPCCGRHRTGRGGAFPGSARLGREGEGKGRAPLTPTRQPAAPPPARPPPPSPRPGPGSSPARPASQPGPRRPLPCPGPLRGFWGALGGGRAARRPPPRAGHGARAWPLFGDPRGSVCGDPAGTTGKRGAAGFFHKNLWKWGFVPKRGAGCSPMDGPKCWPRTEGRYMG